MGSTRSCTVILIMKLYKKVIATVAASLLLLVSVFGFIVPLEQTTGVALDNCAVSIRGPSADEIGNRNVKYHLSMNQYSDFKNEIPTKGKELYCGVEYTYLLFL